MNNPDIDRLLASATAVSLILPLWYVLPLLDFASRYLGTLGHSEEVESPHTHTDTHTAPPISHEASSCCQQRRYPVLAGHRSIPKPQQHMEEVLKIYSLYVLKMRAAGGWALECHDTSLLGLALGRFWYGKLQLLELTGGVRGF